MTEEPDPFATPNPPAPETEAGALVLARCRELVELKKEQERLDDRLMQIAQRRRILDAFLLEAFAENPDLKRLSIGGRTVYLHRQLWAGAPDKAAAHDALVAAGLAEYATKGFNTNSVSALYREWDRDGVQPPSELEGVIKVGERFSIRVTR